jgi:hypothetical protein
MHPEVGAKLGDAKDPVEDAIDRARASPAKDVRQRSGVCAEDHGGSKAVLDVDLAQEKKKNSLLYSMNKSRFIT